MHNNNNNNIDKIREAISGKAVIHIRECEMDNVKVHFVFNSFPGSGKTVSVMKAIADAGYNWMYFAPFHDVIKENLEYSKVRNYNFIHMKGKEQEGVCYVPEYREYAKMGLSITSFCESKCPFRNNGCPYYESRREIESFPQPWAGVHSHIPTYFQTFLYDTEYNGRRMLNYFDVIIIDEFPIQSLYNQVIVQRKDIDAIREVISYMRKDSDEKEFVKTFLDELTLASGTIDIKYTKLKSFLSNHRGLNLKNFLRYYENTLLDLVSHETIKKPPKNIIFSLLSIYEENPSKEKLEWMIRKHIPDGWMRSGIYLTTSNIKYFQNLPVPVIALDATAEIKAWNVLLGDNCENLPIDIEYKNLYQLRTKARYPVSTWIQIEDKKQFISNSGIRLCKLIIEICKRKQYAVLLCSNKRIEKIITNYLKKNYNKDNYEFATFYNLRSRNRYYENCDTCIVTHEPNIPALQLDIIHNVIDWDKKLLEELTTKSEIKQAIGRIRQNILETPEGRIRDLPIEIYLLPGALREKNKFLPEAKLIAYNDMLSKNLVDVRSKIIELIKESNGTTFASLERVVVREEGKMCSRNILMSEVKKLFREGYITNFRKNIEWNYEKERKIKYKINNEYI